MATYFTSDTHFGDHRMLNLYKRPFASTSEMDEALAAAWNATIGAEDDVWHLGDFAMPKVAPAMLDRLAGRKHLVAGNNDPETVRALAGWDSVADYAELTIEGVRLVLCHFPFRSWNGMAKGALNLHGHSHGRMKPLPRQIDVGVDGWAMRPVSLGEIVAATRA